jgi:AcrR family transcriptional regulator
MPRRRVHDLDHVLDTAERLTAELGAGGVTVRALAAAADVPNGTIYHGFGSLNALLAQAWLRAAEAFLRLQTELIEQALPAGAREAVVAAATAPAIFAEQRPAAARMLFTVRREQLLGPDLPDADAEALHGLDARLVQVLIRLAHLLWDRRDRHAVEVVTTCVVDLPTALFRRALTGPSADGAVHIDTDRRERLAAAVRAVLDLPPTPLPTRKG